MPLSKNGKLALYGGIVVGGGAIVYMYVKKKNKAQTAASGAIANAYGYGSQSANGQYAYGAYGYGAYTYAPYGYGYGPYGLGEYPGGSYYGYGYYGAGVGVQVPTQASTNAEWSQAAITALSAQGYTGQSVTQALGLYLSGRPLTPDQANIIYAAIGVEGYPPVTGNNGMPPGLNTSSGGGTGQTSNVTVPNVIGLEQAQAFEVIQSEGLKPVGAKPTKGKILYVHTENPPAGASVKKGSTVKLSSSFKKG